ncbi:DUF4232 domain-containing protein [Streptomyces sp. B1866]|uniref:DUF4232 domain-containing protein n=1 Tax=Streptomyces sp. B1866 TaxID=3075431 RepID=UPI002890D2C8|nr:DUF4232 domain-containing protein [Streptomyces sp. B1866]MDT3396477.1 DUF4232 domain-containing protein [Streptomyces sp. B1866]
MPASRALVSLAALAVGTTLAGLGGTAAHASGSRSAAARPPALCKAAQLKVTVKKVSRPANHLLITAKNTSRSRCDMGILGEVAFDGRIRATPPQGVGGGPDIVAPGQSRYEGVLLVGRGAHGSGTAVTKLAVKLDSGDTATVPVNTRVNKPAHGTWQHTEQDALRRP